MPLSQKPGTPTEERGRNLFLLLTCVLVPAVLIVSFLPGSEKYVLHTKGRLHVPGHLITFGVLAFVAIRAARSLQARTMLFAITLFSGFAIELAEHLIYRSYMEWSDVLIDSIGVLAGAILATLTLSATTPSRSALGNERPAA